MSTTDNKANALPPVPHLPPSMSVTEAARMFGIDRSELYRAARARRVRGIYHSRGRRLVVITHEFLAGLHANPI